MGETGKSRMMNTVYPIIRIMPILLPSCRVIMVCQYLFQSMLRGSMSIVLHFCFIRLFIII
jgi:hypothetical protein